MKCYLLGTNFPFGKMVVWEARVVAMTQGDKVFYKVGVTKQRPWLTKTRWKKWTQLPAFTESSY